MLIYDGVDPAGGLQYSRYDRTRVESVFKEALRKETGLRESHPRSMTFQMNLVNGNKKGDLLSLKHSHDPNMVLTEKVQARTPLERNTEPPGKRSEADEYGNRLIRHTEKAPWQKVDLPQSRAQEIGWLIASSMQYKQLMAQRANTTRASQVGNAKLEAYRSSSLADLSGGKLNEDGSSPPKGTTSITKSKSSPSFIPHLPNEGMRPEAHMLNNWRFRRPKRTCALTDYADKYYAVMRHSPYNQSAARGGAVNRESRD